MLSGAELRGPQTLEVDAADQGAGLASVQIAVNGSPAGGDDLSAACNPLPGGFTSRLAPCPPSFAKTYTLNTERPPFANGANSVSVCVYDYAQSGTPTPPANRARWSSKASAPARRSAAGRRSTPASPATARACAPSPTGAGADPRAGARLRPQPGRRGGGLRAGPRRSARRPYQLIGTATTNQNGGFSSSWARRLAGDPGRLPLRRLRPPPTSPFRSAPARPSGSAAARSGPAPTAASTSRGRSPARCNASRVVILCGTVPGARRRFLVRRARTDALGRFRVGYAFSPVAGPTKFVFWVVVPEQNSYPYSGGRSPRRYIWVRP